MNKWLKEHKGCLFDKDWHIHGWHRQVLSYTRYQTSSHLEVVVLIQKNINPILYHGPFLKKKQCNQRGLLTYLITELIAFPSVAWVTFARHGSFWQWVVNGTLCILSTGLEFDTGVHTLLVNTGLPAWAISISFASIVRNYFKRKKTFVNNAYLCNWKL